MRHVPVRAAVTAPPAVAVASETSLRSSRALQTTVLTLSLAALRMANPDRPLPIDLCVFKTMTGWPCPTCGLTRAVCHALRGEWAASAGYHPAGVIVAAALVVWTAWSLAEAIGGRSFEPLVRDRLSSLAVAAVVALSLANWGWALGAGL